jgi:hypothetical protein
MDALKWARLRLAVAIVLFVGWIGWLVYLAVMATPRPPTLSRSQLLESNLDVIAQIDQLDPPKIKMDDVHWPQTKQAQSLKGATIEVSNLASAEGWKGPGRYIVPLRTNWHGSYEVAPLPPTPGFESARPRIYPAMPETLRQLDEISKPDFGALPDNK